MTDAEYVARMAIQDYAREITWFDIMERYDVDQEEAEIVESLVMDAVVEVRW